jgi:hypothetical protein
MALMGLRVAAAVVIRPDPESAAAALPCLVNADARTLGVHWVRTTPKSGA